MSPQNAWLWKATGLPPNRIKDCMKLRLTLKDSSTDSHTLRPSAKAAGWKMLRQHVREIHWLCLKCLYKQQGSIGTLGTEVLADAIFTLSLYLSGAACFTPASSGGLVHSARCSPIIPQSCRSVQSTGDCPSTPGSSGQGALYFWVSWDCNSWTEFLAGYHPQGITKTAEWNTPRLPVTIPLRLGERDVLPNTQKVNKMRKHEYIPNERTG